MENELAELKIKAYQNAGERDKELLERFQKKTYLGLPRGTESYIDFKIWV